LIISWYFNYGAYQNLKESPSSPYSLPQDIILAEDKYKNRIPQNGKDDRKQNKRNNESPKTCKRKPKEKAQKPKEHAHTHQLHSYIANPQTQTNQENSVIPTPRFTCGP